MSLIRLRENLRYLRATRSYTQEQVGNMIGIGAKVYQTWELGRITPDTPRLFIISQLYDVSINDLVRKDLTKVFTINSQN